MNSSHYYNLGCIYWKKKEWQKVNDVWEKGLHINPKDENILRNLPDLKKYFKVKIEKITTEGVLNL